MGIPPYNGERYTVTNVPSTPSATLPYAYSDMFGCHGTSGSGVFNTGTTWLMGPTQESAGSLWNQRLCLDVDGDPDDTTDEAMPGDLNLVFGRSWVSREVEYYATGDR